MSTTPLPRVLHRLDGLTSDEAQGCTPRRRVRHEARDAVAVMLFSAAASSGVAVLLTLVVKVGG